MTYGITVKDLCVRFNPQALNIDERKLVQFGLMNGIIQRLHQYPVHTVSPDDLQCSAAGRLNAIHKLCNGLHSYDEICCKLSLTHKELHKLVEEDPNILVLWK